VVGGDKGIGYTDRIGWGVLVKEWVGRHTLHPVSAISRYGMRDKGTTRKERVKARE
jgi:hypothetical protein